MSAARRRGKGGFRTRLTSAAAAPERAPTPARPHPTRPVIVTIGGRPVVFRAVPSMWDAYRRMAPDLTRYRELGARVEILMKIVALFVSDADLEYIKGTLTSADGGTSIAELMAAVDKVLADMEIQLIRAAVSKGPGDEKDPYGPGPTT